MICQYNNVLDTERKGIVKQWSGTIATIPDGYALCDGNNGTPDLRDRFIVCASVDNSGVAKTMVDDGQLLQSGGTVNLSVAMTAFGQTNSLSGNVTIFQGAGSTVSVATNTHTHGVSADAISEPQTFVPPYFALAYIMKL